MRTKNPKIAKLITDCAKTAKSQSNKCMHPNCNDKAINSHIMQKNGILSSIADKNHLWELSVDHFKEEYIGFKKTGINKIYTFTGFCNNHDTSIFSKIETEGEIDFEDYESCLLFALRTAYNEIWVKEVVIKLQECLLLNTEIEINENVLQKTIKQNRLALKDMEFYTTSMWEDLNSQSESFVFEFREMEYQEICLNSIYTYDTSKEIMEYQYKYGKDMERPAEIFISFFPYAFKSILLMGYHKDDTSKVKSFVNLFFKENKKRTNRRLSSLISFNCETWVCSPAFYEQKFKGLDSEFFKAMQFSGRNGNERKTFDVDFFKPDFRSKFKTFIEKNGG
ncbi:hypothetical protein [Dokdonia sp. PRO95]|uniref:hypothetical protein n=1 Tax=Dokdonia sp. PRO95 TaxID=1239415 RepID=UPI0005582E98|nr:hypothetical protein [Dokdonia sp. PRO95]